jgi:DNA mismatch repair protein MutS
MAAPDRSAPQTSMETASPMLAQYLGIKVDHPDALLFYRMGDFYELFFDDAVAASRALDITLTKRGQHQGQDIPMCGVPVHTAEAYLARLIRSGFKVAVCEQVEDPAEARKRGGKSVVQRAVVRLVTPGTLTEDALLDARAHNYLGAVARVAGDLALAWLDLSTGDFRTAPTGLSRLAADLARIAPGEVLVPDSLAAEPALADWQARLTILPAVRFDSTNGERRLCAAYAVATLDAFGAFDRAEVAAAGALLDYLDLTQRGTLPRLAPPQRESADAVLLIDAATRRNLELSVTLTGERGGSLLGTIDRTCSAAGARLLAQRLAAPLTDAAAIVQRHDQVAAFIAQADTRRDVRDLLTRLPDVARATTRLAMGRGGPRDLAGVRDALALAPALARHVMALGIPALQPLAAALGRHDDLVSLLRAALGDDLPLLARDGGFVATGYNAQLDELRVLRDESRRHIAALQARYAEDSGVANLKIRHNNVLGYYVEVAPNRADRLDQRFIHRQTMANAMRYTTTELGELEGRIAQAADRALALELETFADLVGRIGANGDVIAAFAQACAALDVAAAAADLAAEQDWCRPVLDASTTFTIVGGRHPVVEAGLRQRGEGAFIANDSALEPDRRLWLVTGPNMAGKSTFLRQNALIVVLAQAGLYVPAREARIGIVDRLFSRVGAADDLARGRSTFMVEMVEAAAILNQATPRSLVILDEIGRGTATFDGLSIAWSAVEHLHDVNRCRALFATHYHELTVLAQRLPALHNVTMKVKEWRGDVVFLHEVAAGAADRSYGIQVAKLAGLPPAVIKRAQAVLAQLEKGRQAGALARLVDDLPLFNAAQSATEEQGSAVEAELRNVRIDDLSPRQAQDLLYRLRTLLPD